MALMSSTETAAAEKSATAQDKALLARHGAGLLQLARESIALRVRKGSVLAVEPLDHPPELRALRATFVTLNQEGALRGCVGSAVAWRVLVADVAENAAAAAVEDPRFAPLAVDQIETIKISLSLLSTSVRIHARDEAELLAQLEPGRDGLILHESRHSALFLPQVWQHLPEPRQFLAQLKAKAGLPENHWSSGFEFRRFTCISVAEPGAHHR